MACLVLFSFWGLGAYLQDVQLTFYSWYTNKHVQNFKGLSNVFLAIGIALLSTGGWLAWKTFKFKSEAEVAEGTVIGLVEHTSSSSTKKRSGGSTWAPVVEYVGPDRQIKTYTSKISSSNPYSYGDKVKIYYDKSDADHVIMDGIDGFFFALLVGGFGLFFIIFRGVYFFIRRNE
jgi:hypothetical protein